MSLWGSAELEIHNENFYSLVSGYYLRLSVV